MTIDESIKSIEQELDAPIPRSAVAEREGGNGMKLSYLQGFYVIDRLNKVFGAVNWSSETILLKPVFEGVLKDRYNKEKHHVSYVAQVKLTVTAIPGFTTFHVCTGYGDGMDPTNPGKAHELAVKEAETDALKRCAKNLGKSMGLALYDKEQTYVEDDTPPKPSGAASPSLSTPPSAGMKPTSSASKTLREHVSPTLPPVDPGFKASVIAEIKKTQNLTQLKTVWEKHWPKIQVLPAQEQDEIVAFKDATKNRFGTV